MYFESCTFIKGPQLSKILYSLHEISTKNVQSLQFKIKFLSKLLCNFKNSSIATFLFNSSDVTHVMIFTQMVQSVALIVSSLKIEIVGCIAIVRLCA